MEPRVRTGLGLGLWALGMVFILAFHAGMNRPLQVTSEVAMTAGGAVGAWALVSRALPWLRAAGAALAVATLFSWAFDATQTSGVPLDVLGPANLAGIAAKTVALPLLAIALLRWPARLGDPGAARLFGAGAALLALAWLAFTIADLSSGFIGLVHATALAVVGLGLAAWSAAPLERAPARPAARAAPGNA